MCADVCGGIVNENTIPVMIECIYRGQDACDVCVRSVNSLSLLCLLVQNADDDAAFRIAYFIN